METRMPSQCAAGAALTIALGVVALPASASVVDFESYAEGDAINLINPGPGVVGTPYPVLYLTGTVEHDPSAGIGDYLNLGPTFTTSDQPGFRLVSYRQVSENMRYTPFFRSLDVFAEKPFTIAARDGRPAIDVVAGAWQTIHLDFHVTGNTTFKLRGGEVWVDNFVFDDDFTGVPEPATWGLLIAGFGMMGAGLRRRRPEWA